jgi:hypothetical protein
MLLTNLRPAADGPDCRAATEPGVQAFRCD